MVFGEHNILADDTNAPGRKRKTKPDRLATGEATRIADLISSFYPSPPPLRAQFAGEGSISRVQAENVGKGLNEAFDQLNPMADAPWPVSVWEKCIFGRSAELIVPGEQYWYDFPAKTREESERAWQERSLAWRRKAPLPIMWLSLPAKSTFPPSLSAIDDEVLCTKKVTWIDLRDMFDDGELAGTRMPEASDRKRLYEELTLGIYSNRRWLAYVLLDRKKSGGYAGTPLGADYHDKVLRSLEHGLERCAIRIQPGLTSGRKEAPYYWRSVIYPVRELIKSADRLASRAATSAKFNAYPWMKWHKLQTEGGGEAGEGASSDIEAIREGDITILHPGDAQAGIGREDIGPVFQPQAGQETRELLIWILDLTRAMTGTLGVLEGEMGPAGQPAWSKNFSAEMAKNRLRPFTSRVIAGAIDTAETISRAVISFDEPVILAKLDDDGNRAGDIRLLPDELRKYQPVLAGTYEAKVPINFRADLDLMMNLVVTAKKAGVSVPSPLYLAERLAGIENFYEQWEESQEVEFMESEEIKTIQRKYLADRFEASIAKDDGMDAAEFEKIAGQIPEPARSILRQRLGGGGDGVRPETAGALRAGSPFSTPPGGPQPTEQIV